VVSGGRMGGGGGREGDGIVFNFDWVYLDRCSCLHQRREEPDLLPSSALT